jgi:hypothetical protein
MATTTVRKLLVGALRLINVVQANETPTADDMDITLEALEGMIDSWSNDDLMIYTMNPYTFQTVSGQQDYTLGPGGDWNTERPMQIQQAKWHYEAAGVQPVDMPIYLANDAQWASITIKSLQTSIPTVLYDNGNYPLRTISLWPIPQPAQPIILWLAQPLLNFNNLDEVITFPPGYIRALRYCLAVEIAPEFGKQLTPEIISIAGTSKAEVKTTNTVTQYQSFDQGMRGTSGIDFNWISGNWFPMH